MALFSPHILEKGSLFLSGFEQMAVVKAAAGKDFTVLAVKSKNAPAETEIFAAGVNKWGQLGIGELSDCADFTKIRPLSNLNFQNPPGSATRPMEVINLACGSDHCLCLTNMGVLFEWGANDNGQLGNRRRAFAENPLIVDSLTDKRVTALAAAYTFSAAVLEPESSN